MTIEVGQAAAVEAEADVAARLTAEGGPSAERTAVSHPVLRAFLRSPGGVIGGVILLALIVIAIIAPSIWGSAATTPNLAIPYQSSSAAHPLGTDGIGRDVLARTLVATRTSLELGALGASIAVLLGFGVGVLVAAFRPRARSVGRRVIEISMSFPSILLALFLVTIIGTGEKGAVIAVGVGSAPGFARLAESYATSVTSREFVASARAMGLSRLRIITRYLLPNMAEPLVVGGLAYFAGAIIDISGLSFLGVGVQPPTYDWGSLLAEGIKSIYVTPWATIGPSFMIVLTGTAIVYLSEGLARALNPRLWFSHGGAGRARRAVLNLPSPSRALIPAPTPEEPVLRVEGLSVYAPASPEPLGLVKDVSFALQPGEVVGIVGESGSGKTLTALAIAQLLPHPLVARSAALELDGAELSGKSGREQSRLLGTKLAMIFQDPMSSLNPAARVGSQLTDGARVHRGLSRRTAIDEAVERLKQVRIGDASRAVRRYPHQFSGGMQQRVMIAMGLMATPRVLVADEPTTALDVTIQAQVLGILREIKDKEHTAIVLISHNLGVVNQICDRVLVMYAGRIVEEGSRDVVLRQPQHPYTRSLLASIPDISSDGTSARLTAIPGQPPSAGDDVPGCPFAARCDFAEDRCRSQLPTLEAVAPGHRVACLVATDAGSLPPLPTPAGGPGQEEAGG